MLQEYKWYIENIRNNLIQNNINIEVKSIETYRDLFLYTYALEQVIWFFRILNISGSQFSRSCKFIYEEQLEEKARQLAYKDFMEVVENYRSLSARYYKLQKLKELQKTYKKIEIDLDKEISLDEEIDKFSEKNENDYDKSKEFLDISGIENENMLNLYQSQEVETVNHGIFIDEWVKVSNNEKSNMNIENESNFAEHGLYIDEYISKKSKIFTKSDNVDFIEDILVEDTKEIQEDFVDSDLIFSDNDEDSLNYLEEDINEDYIENDLEYEEESDVDFEDEEVSDYFTDEDSTKFEDDISYIEDDIFEESDIEFSEEESEGDIEINFKEEEKFNISENLKSEISNRTKDDSNSSKINKNRDISDSLQDITNKLVNKGIKIISKAIKD